MINITEGAVSKSKVKNTNRQVVKTITQQKKNNNKIKQFQKQPQYSHNLLVNVIENYGQLRVCKKGTNQVLPKVYVKAYARFKDGNVGFYKDGYTDIRGKFDYASLSTSDLDNVDRFAILVMSEEFGSDVYEANPPKY